MKAKKKCNYDAWDVLCFVSGVLILLLILTIVLYGVMTSRVNQLSDTYQKQLIEDVKEVCLEIDQPGILTEDYLKERLREKDYEWTDIYISENEDGCDLIIESEVFDRKITVHWQLDYV